MPRGGDEDFGLLSLLLLSIVFVSFGASDSTERLLLVLGESPVMGDVSVVDQSNLRLPMALTT